MINITIKLNGKDMEIPVGSTISNLLNITGIKSKMFVVEKNKEIVDKTDYDTCQVSESDVIEIVGFFGGG